MKKVLTKDNKNGIIIHVASEEKITLKKYNKVM